MARRLGARTSEDRKRDHEGQDQTRKHPELQQQALEGGGVAVDRVRAHLQHRRSRSFEVVIPIWLSSYRGHR
jgi:hypothetical protein